MGILAVAGQTLDRLGLRGMVAMGTTAVYGTVLGRRQQFSTDAAGNWVNQHAEATIVSPIIHTTRFEAYRDWVMDNWAWQYQPQVGDTIIDVGAGVGEEAVVFSKLVGPSGKVVSIEAHPLTYACLQATLRNSRISNVIPIGYAITDKDGTVSIDDTQNHLANSVMTEGGAQSIPSRSLDSLAEELGLGPIALLKMNIEGAERLAVAGMTALSKQVRHVVISCHDFVSEAGGGGDEFRTFSEVRKRLEALGFELTTRPDHHHAWTRYYLYGRNRAMI